MASANGSNLTCPNAEWFLKATEKANFIVYYLLTPAYFVLGTAVHSVCLRAFYVEAKKEKGYLYQVFVTVSRIFESFAMSQYVVVQYWLAYDTSPHTAWFRSCYPCMWYTGKFSSAISAISFVYSLLFTVLMCADRLYALWKPHSYKTAYAKRNNPLIAILFTSIAILVNVAQLFFYNIIPSANSSQYQLVLNMQFRSSLLGKIMYNSRSFLEGLGLIVLYMCNAAMIWLFRLRTSEASKTLNKSHEMRRRQEIEKTITLLAISQSMCLTVSITYKAGYVLLVTLDPSFYPCQGPFHQALLMIAVYSMDLLDFVCVFSISKRFRRSILHSMKGSHKTTVVPISNQRNA